MMVAQVTGLKPGEFVHTFGDAHLYLNHSSRDVPQESLMLTGDENIVDVQFSVFWVIANAADYLFNVQQPEGTIKSVAESAMREEIGRNQIQPILTGARQAIETSVQELIQKTLDGYQAGVQITQVQLQKVDPPQQVIDAFRDVQAARADAERLQNEAQAYANRVVPEARGDAARVIQAAEGYRERAVFEARGQADRFIKIYDEYAKAPEVTRRRMYLETMERVFDGMDKVIVDSSTSRNGGGVVPYLPLNELGRTGQTARRDPRPQRREATDDEGPRRCDGRPRGNCRDRRLYVSLLRSSDGASARSALWRAAARDHEPGLEYKLPFVDTVVMIDKRILDLDNPAQEVIASDQKRLVVDAFARYRISDPLRSISR
jgi:HflK protein